MQYLLKMSFEAHKIVDIIFTIIKITHSMCIYMVNSFTTQKRFEKSQIMCSLFISAQTLTGQHGINGWKSLYFYGIFMTSLALPSTLRYSMVWQNWNWCMFRNALKQCKEYIPLFYARIVRFNLLAFKIMDFSIAIQSSSSSQWHLLILVLILNWHLCNVMSHGIAYVG